MMINEVLTQNGNLYKVGQGGVSGIVWAEDGDILVQMSPLRKRLGDRDGWYNFRRQVVIKSRWVAEVTLIATEGSFAGC